MAPDYSRLFKASKHFWGWLERWMVAVLFSFLLLMALLQIVLRNFFSTGFLWADVLMRHILLWIALLGASIATLEGRHIHIDLFPKLLSVSAARGLIVFNLAFQVLISALLFYASLKFVSNERMAGDIAFLGIPFWWIETIFPLSFAVMTLRFTGCLVRELPGRRPERGE